MKRRLSQASFTEEMLVHPVADGTILVLLYLQHKAVCLVAATYPISHMWAAGTLSFRVPAVPDGQFLSKGHPQFGRGPSCARAGPDICAGALGMQHSFPESVCLHTPILLKDVQHCHFCATAVC